MSRIARWVGLALLVALVLSVSTGLAGAGRGAGPRAQGGHGGDDGAQAFDQALEKAGFTAAETTAITAMMEAKQAAHQELRRELDTLRRIAMDPKATDEQLKKATAEYRRVRERTDQKFAALDKELAGKLSVRSQARALAMGLLDNGFGMGMGPRGGGGGGGGRQSRGGGGRRAGARTVETESD